VIVGRFKKLPVSPTGLETSPKRNACMILRLSIGSLLLLAVGAGAVSADPPTASYIFPAGGQRGKTVDIRVGGLNLHRKCSVEMLGPGVKCSGQLQRTDTVWFEGPLIPLPDSQQAEDYPKDMSGRVQIAPDAPLGARYWRLWNSQGATSAKRFIVGDLREIVEEEIDGNPVPVEVKLPVTINGRIFPREDVDIWTFQARKNQVITAEVCAARLGSPLDSRLEVRDPQGRRIAEDDDTFGPDSFVRFTAPADGQYQVRIHDINFRGGQAYVYRLTLTCDSAKKRASLPEVHAQKAQAASPDFHLQLSSDVLAIDRGGQGKLKVTAERLHGFRQPIRLTVEGLPAGVTAMAATIAPEQNAAEISINAGKSVAVRAAHLRIRGKAKISDSLITRTAMFPVGQEPPEVDTVLLAVTLPTPFKIVGDFDMRWAPRGTVHHRRYRIERGGYNGPIEVSLADHQMRHLQGVTGPTIIVPPGATAFDYAVQFPPWMETGRTSRACVVGVGSIRDVDGSEHEVAFSSSAPNEQIIAVIEPGKLGIEAGRGSLPATPGTCMSLPVTVRRSKSIQGSVKIQAMIPTHMRGIVSDAVVIPAGRSSADLPIRFAADMHSPCNAPLVIRATALERGEPVVAEAKVDLQLTR
jgi:hypothetical protein